MSLSLQRPLLLAALLLALPLAASAQSVPASSSSTSSMDMGAMPGMAMPATTSRAAQPATKAHVKKTKTRKKHVSRPSSSSAHDMDGMQGMDHGSMAGMPMPARSTAPAASPGTMSGMDHATMPGMRMQSMQGTDRGAMSGMHHDATQDMQNGGMAAMPGMTMGPMQGGKAPPDARSPDYSDGIGYGDMQGMEMRDDAPLGMLLIDQLEAFHGRDANGQRWEAQGWYGNDTDKLWLRSEGEREQGRFGDGDIEALWSHAVAPYWDTQLGVRHDLGEGPGRDWAAFGVQGLAPYWFEWQATAYAGSSGRTAARLRVDYELLFTQRLILQPEFEANLYGKADSQRRIGAGLADASLGLRLRYEIRRQFAPYVGVSWQRRFGGTADYARQDGHPVFDRQIVAGVRFWF